MIYDCAVIGNWHLAFTTAASLAQLGKRVLLVNPLSPLLGSVTPWTEFPVVPVNEPGMPESIAKSKSAGRLDYANGFSGDWQARHLWLAIDTPVNDRDEADTAVLFEAALAVKKSGRVATPFVVSSQVPMGFGETLEREYGLKVAYVPENLRLGKGLETFLKADRTVIGSNHPEVSKSVRELLECVETDYFFCDLVTSEMVKHATNAFLATSISFANELARVGERMGVDNQKVAQALKLDKRIGKGAYVAPGLGFAGGTLPRDLRALQKFGQRFELKTSLVDSVLSVNDSTYQAVQQTMELCLSQSGGKNILFLGYTYKAETDTLRRSPAIELAQGLKKKGYTLFGYDPMMNSRDLSELKDLIQHSQSVSEVPTGIDLVVVLTARPEFKKLDWKSLVPKCTLNSKHAVVLDTVQGAQSTEVLAAGFAYKALWQPVQKREKS